MKDRAAELQVGKLGTAQNGVQVEDQPRRSCFQRLSVQAPGNESVMADCYAQFRADDFFH